MYIQTQRETRTERIYKYEIPECKEDFKGFYTSPKVILNCVAFILYWLCVSRKWKRTISAGEYETPEFDKAEKHG